ncbi:ATP-binding cassette domain-containing protein, partial [Lacticaseibacillus rhamnosus]
RATSSMSAPRQPPETFRRPHPKFKTPWLSLLVFAGLFSFLFLLPGNVDFIGRMYAFGAMLSFTIAHAAVIQLRRKPPPVVLEAAFANRQPMRAQELLDAGRRDVEFRYPGRELNALNGVSFSIRAGERVGIIGRVGSGKSTIAKLLVGLYQPQSGGILVDGTDIRQIDPMDP